jgi:hypothetical protein
MLAQRLFIVASGQYYLHNLRSLGFQTFDKVIDERYDTIENLEQRMQAVCDTAKSLDGRDPAVAAITHHNYHHLLTTDWTGIMIENIKQNLLGI